MKKAILMMTFGSPEEITFEGVADFFHKYSSWDETPRPRDSDSL